MDETGVASKEVPQMCAQYVRTFATGLRNSYDFVFHSTGNIWATDNALGVTGSFPKLPEGYKQGVPPPVYINAFEGDACDTGLVSNNELSMVNPGDRPDLLINVREGYYYGHPNPCRR